LPEARTIVRSSADQNATHAGDVDEITS